MISTRLREHTAALHQRVERSVDLDRRCRSLAEYQQWLGRLLGLLDPLERTLGAIDWRPAGLDFGARRKAPWLIADLRALGVDLAGIAALPRYPAVARVDSLAAALGCLYVLEGATLGGTIIARQVRERLGLESHSGASFFAGYGVKTGAMWRHYRAAADRYVGEDSARIAAALAAADWTFGAFDDWLAPSPSPIPTGGAAA